MKQQISWSEIGWIDTRDREAVVSAFAAEFNKPATSSNWSGTNATCDAGQTDVGFRQAVLARVNWFRAMAGVPGTIAEDPARSAIAQQTAQMMSASRQLSHTPDESFACHTQPGDDLAGESNLAIGLHGPEAINAYIRDAGASNASVGHRTWILNPPTKKMGTGDIPPGPNTRAANALYVLDNYASPHGTIRQPDGSVAWPPAGYVPGEVVYDRWSFGHPRADLSNASVTVTAHGTDIPLTVIRRPPFLPCPVGLTCSVFLEPIVWEPAGIDRDPPIDQTYEIAIEAELEGKPISFSYSVTVLGDSAGPPPPSPTPSPPPLATTTTTQSARSESATSATSATQGFPPASLSEAPPSTSRTSVAFAPRGTEPSGTETARPIRPPAITDSASEFRRSESELRTSPTDASLERAAPIGNPFLEAKVLADILSSESFTRHHRDVVRTYIAFFGSAPEPTQILEWLGAADRTTAGRAAAEFAVSPRFATTYQTLSDQAFVESFYRNELRRTARDEALDYWIANLNAESVTRAELVAALASSDEFGAIHPM